MLVLSGAEVERCFTVTEALASAEAAFTQLARGTAEVPHRTSVDGADGPTLFMPARLGREGVAGVKVVAVHPGNATRGLPVVPATLLLVDDTTGRPLALLDATGLTARRTAAASALATRYLARPEARVLAIVGAGAQARAHLDAMPGVRGIEEVRVVSRTVSKATEWARDVDAAGRVHAQAARSVTEAVAGADIVCCCTSSPTPVLRGRDLAPGVHVNAIGAYTATTRELDDDAVLRAHRIVVDSRATLMTEAGDLAIPIRAGLLAEDRIYAELGEFVVGKAPGRQRPDEVTLFKSVGNAAQDVAAGVAIVRRARELGLGRDIPVGP